MIKKGRTIGSFDVVKPKSKFKKNTALLLLMPLAYLMGFYGSAAVHASSFNKNMQILQVYQDGKEYVVKVTSKIKDKDISSNAKIAYKKLKLKNSIKTSDIKDGAITAEKLAPGVVSIASIADNSITGNKIQDGTITDTDLDPNINITTSGNVVANSFVGDLTGDVTGNLTGNVTGDVVGNVAGNLTGNADTATTLTGLIASIAELNILDGVTADAAALNITSGGIDFSEWGQVCANNEIPKYDSLSGNWVCGTDLDGAVATTYTANELGLHLDGSNEFSIVLDGTTLSQSGAGLKLADAYAATLLGVGAAFGGDVSGTYDNIVVADDSHNHTGATVSGLAVANFTSPNISNWTNDAGYIVSGSGAITGADLDPAININTTGDIVANSFTGNLIGNVTGNLTGNADTATTLAGLTATIAELNILNGVTADTAEINVVDGGIDFSELTGTATDVQIPDTITAANYLALAGGTMTGDIDMGTNDISNAGIITAGTFVGDLTGNVTGDIIGDLTGDVTGNVSGNAGTVTNGVYTTGAYADPAWITSLAGLKITGTVANATDAVNAGTAAVASDIIDDSITSAKILDGEIAGADLATDIDIDTTGSVTAGTFSDGTVSMTGGDVSSTSHAMNIEVGNDGTDSDVFITNTGGGQANLHVEGNITGGSLGASGSRWSTIYADTVNFLTGLTNADNTAGPDSTINLGTAGADSAEVHIGNANANVSLTDANWSISGTGTANFASIGAGTPGTGDFTTLTSSGNADLDSLDVANNATIIGTLDAANITTLTLAVTNGTTLGDQLTVTAGGLDITGVSHFRDDINLHDNDILSVKDITSSGTISGTFSSDADLDMNNNDITSVKDITAGGTISGTIDATGGHNSNITVKGSDGNDCNINISHGIITGTTCP